jgi:hypothetical protein
MSTDTGVIWRGFHHAWRYNHRLNRLGSYLQRTADTEPGWKAVHTAASGTGPDTAQFCDLYTEVAAPDVAFQATQDKIHLTGDESSLVSEPATVAIDLDEALKGLDEYAVVLNGFDIVSEADADKLMSLSISVEQPSDPSEGSLTFDATVTFSGDCGTPECSEPGIDYTCYLFFLVIGGKQSAFRVGPQTQGTATYGWTLNREPDRKREGVSTDHVPAADLWDEPNTDTAVGLTEFSVDLTKTADPPTTSVIVEIADRLKDLGVEPHRDAMHLLELDLSVEKVSANTGLDIDYLTFYKNWAHGMKQFLPDDFLQSAENFMPESTQNALESSDQLTIHDFVDPSIWTHRNGGEASLAMTGRVLQFADTTIFNRNAVPGAIDWPGENRDAKKFDEARFDVREDTRTDEPGDARHETKIV